MVQDLETSLALVPNVRLCKSNYLGSTSLDTRTRESEPGLATQGLTRLTITSNLDR
jgi:hypothetical protein